MGELALDGKVCQHFLFVRLCVAIVSHEIIFTRFNNYDICRYGFSAFIINEFGGKDIACGESDIRTEECPLHGTSVIASYGIEGIWTSVWLNVSMLVAIQIFLRISTYILIRRAK